MTFPINKRYIPINELISYVYTKTNECNDYKIKNNQRVPVIRFLITYTYTRYR